MRKLTLLATTAMAAMALMAAAAPAAHADREFIMIDPPTGLPCDPCYDTGYAGSIDFENTLTEVWVGGCEVRFDMEMLSDGALETYNTEIDSCDYGTSVVPCDDSWTGQLRLPDTGPSKIDLQVCVQPTFGGAQTSHDITLTVYNNPRRWEQSTEDRDGNYTLIDAYFEDGYSADNVGIQLL